MNSLINYLLTGLVSEPLFRSLNHGSHTRSSDRNTEGGGVLSGLLTFPILLYLRLPFPEPLPGSQGVFSLHPLNRRGLFPTLNPGDTSVSPPVSTDFQSAYMSPPTRRRSRPGTTSVLLSWVTTLYFSLGTCSDSVTGRRHTPPPVRVPVPVLSP